ncbi:hypothetical protein DPMN_098422 [Dreissena polymorpha]|uniref:Uncharacterized protein n=1 Tax=Dreissena polymorpha TaxID=45954 RepID=A0A9D4LEN6_DREPO|nr:hypothetical protein DPMN_098422 [Dreissena polymorpha]
MSATMTKKSLTHRVHIPLSTPLDQCLTDIRPPQPLVIGRPQTWHPHMVQPPTRQQTISSIRPPSGYKDVCRSQQ